MKETTNIMTIKNVHTSSSKTSTNGDAIKNEREGQPEKLGFFSRLSDTAQVIVVTGLTVAGVIVIGALGGAVATAIKESSARKTLNSDGFKEHDALISKEYIARVERGLYDEPKTLEEAAARMLERAPQIIVHDSFYGTTEPVTSGTSSLN